jgi:hypothetical protein
MIRIGKTALLLACALVALSTGRAAAEVQPAPREDAVTRLVVFSACKTEEVLKFYRQNEDVAVLLRANHWRWFHKCAAHLVAGPVAKLDDLAKLLGKELHQTEDVKNLTVRVNWCGWLSGAWKYETGPDTPNAANLASQLDLIKALVTNPTDTIRKRLNAGVGFRFYTWSFGVYLPYEKKPFFEQSNS